MFSAHILVVCKKYMCFCRFCLCFVLFVCLLYYYYSIFYFFKVYVVKQVASRVCWFIYIHLYQCKIWLHCIARYCEGHMNYLFRWPITAACHRNRALQEYSPCILSPGSQHGVESRENNKTRSSCSRLKIFFLLQRLF